MIFDFWQFLTIKINNSGSFWASQTIFSGNIELGSAHLCSEGFLDSLKNGRVICVLVTFLKFQLQIAAIQSNKEIQRYPSDWK
jgi:hypothetical protein